LEEAVKEKPWMTANAEGLLTTVLASRWDVLPILADALEEGGFPDGEALLAMRDVTQAEKYLGQSLNDFRWLERVIRQEAKFVEVKEAIDYLSTQAKFFSSWEDSRDDYWDNGGEGPFPIGQTFDWLLGVHDRYVASEEDESLGYNTPDEAGTNAKECWKHYEVLTGVKMKLETLQYGNEPSFEYAPMPFRCSC
jgi:hypothetical protein